MRAKELWRNACWRHPRARMAVADGSVGLPGARGCVKGASGARRLEGIEPGLGRLLAGRLDLGRLLAHEVIKTEIAVAASLSCSIVVQIV